MKFDKIMTYFVHFILLSSDAMQVTLPRAPDTMYKNGSFLSEFELSISANPE